MCKIVYKCVYTCHDNANYHNIAQLLLTIIVSCENAQY